MNIPQISFCARKESQYNHTSSPISQNAAQLRDQLRSGSNLNYDYLEISTKPTPKKPQQKKVKPQQTEYRKPVKKKKSRQTPLKNWLQGFGIGVVTTSLVWGLHSVPNQTIDKTIIPVEYGESITQIADTYNSDEDVICYANNLEGYQIEEFSRRITIPQAYNPVLDEIMQLQEKLYSSKLDNEKRQEIEDRIEELDEQIFEQSQIAQCYTDGEFMYFKITLPTDGTESDIQQQYNGAINVEEFKEIFKIPDGIIKDYNSLGFNWSNGGTVMDYTHEDLVDGEVIKVPMSVFIKE